MNARGFTLTELLIGAALGFMMILALGQVDVSRVRLAEEGRRRAGNDTEAALALAQMGRLLNDADRVQLLGPTNMQFRRFIADPSVPGALDNAANYRWAQYKLVDVVAPAGMDTIQFFDDTNSGCGVDEIFTATDLVIQYRNEAGTPPGGEPAVAPPGSDNNVLQILISGRFSTDVTIRAGAYTGVMTGLVSPGVSNPPAPC